MTGWCLSSGLCLLAIQGQTSASPARSNGSTLTQSQFPNAEVDDYLEQLKKLQEDLRAYGIKAFESQGSREEKLAEMTEKLKLTIEHPEPAPEAKKLIETLLQRCFVWVALIKTK